MRWTKGRQNTGYEKLTFINKGFRCWMLLGFDCHLLRYTDGSFIPPHTDAVESGRHHRINLVLKKPKKGGIFKCSQAWKIGQRLFYFRPDIHEHEVSECVGTRYVLSLGWVLDDAK